MWSSRLAFSGPRLKKKILTKKRKHILELCWVSNERFRREDFKKYTH